MRFFSISMVNEKRGVTRFSTSDDLGTRERARAMHEARGHAWHVRLHADRSRAEAKRRFEPAAPLITRRIEHL
jgi:hypothetical protein